MQPVQGDLFTYWETLHEGQLELIVSNPPYLTAAEMEQLAVPRRGAGIGDRLAAAGSRNRPAGGERLGRHPLHSGLWRQRPLRDRPSPKINWKKQTTSCCNILILCYTKKESEGQPALCGPKG